MTWEIFQYIIIWIFAVMAVFSFLIGTEKMVKIIIWNYIIWFWLLCMSMLFNLLVYIFNNNSNWNFLWIPYWWLAKFIESGQITILLLLYLWALLLLFLKSFVSITLPSDPLKRNIILLALIPWTIFSLIFTLEIVIFGIKLFNVEQLVELSKILSNNKLMENFVMYTPLRMLIHSIWALWITTELDIKYNTPTYTQINNWWDSFEWE